jgi:hypothetical protein
MWILANRQEYDALLQYIGLFWNEKLWRCRSHTVYTLVCLILGQLDNETQQPGGP